MAIAEDEGRASDICARYCQFPEKMSFFPLRMSISGNHDFCQKLSADLQSSIFATAACHTWYRKVGLAHEAWILRPVRCRYYDDCADLISDTLNGNNYGNVVEMRHGDRAADVRDH
jgi:hypothetical protein